MEDDAAPGVLKGPEERLFLSPLPSEDPAAKAGNWRRALERPSRRPTELFS